MATALSTLQWGSYYPTANNRADIYESRQYGIGRQFDINSWFISFDSTVASHQEMIQLAQAAQPAGSVTALIAMQPSRTTPFTMDNILAGTYDSYLQSWADYMFTFPGPVVVRFGHEFNGDFMAWNPVYSGGNNASISAISNDGSSTTTITTSAANSLTTGQYVRISGIVGPTALNAVWAVTVIDSTHFTIQATNSTTWTSGGTIKWSKVTKNPANFIAAWQYVVTYFRNRATATGKTNNVKWYWCANCNDSPGNNTPMEQFYPGNAYVDIVGFDNYNSLNGLWMTPLQTIQGYTNSAQANAYTRVTAVGTNNQPVWLGELNCVDVNDPKDINPTVATGHSKGQWYSDLFTQDLSAVPRLQAINFFDSSGTRNWPFDSTTAAYSGFVSSFVTGTYNPAQAPNTTPGQPPAWTGYTMPGPEAHIPLFNADGTLNPQARSLGGEISAIWHYLNQISGLTGGWNALKGNTDGTGPALNLTAAATGTIAQPILNIQNASNTLKAILAIYAATGDTSPTFQVNQDGSIRFGPGGSTAADVRVQRGGANTIQVTGYLNADNTVTAPSSAIPLNAAANQSAQVATRPGASGGIKVYAYNDALYVSRVTRNSLLVPRPASIHGKFGYTCDPETATTSSTYSAGQITLHAVELADTRTIATVGLNVLVAGAGLSNCYVGIVESSTGVLLGQSADLSTVLSTTGEKNIAITVQSGQTLPGNAGQRFFVALLIGAATTNPAFSSNNSGVINRGLTGTNSRCLLYGSGQTSLPSTIPMGSASQTNKLLYADIV